MKSFPFCREADSTPLRAGIRHSRHSSQLLNSFKNTAMMGGLLFTRATRSNQGCFRVLHKKGVRDG